MCGIVVVLILSMHKVASSNPTIYSIYDFHMHLAPALPLYHNLSANPALHPSEVV